MDEDSAEVDRGDEVSASSDPNNLMTIPVCGAWRPTAWTPNRRVAAVAAVRRWR